MADERCGENPSAPLSQFPGDRLMAKETSNAPEMPDWPGRGLAVRAGQHFFIQLLRSLSTLTDGDIILAIVLVSVLDANTELLRRMDGNPGSFAIPNGPPPDELLQPVSVYAVAKNIGIPYETARRYVAKLVGMGLCAKVGEKGGVIVPATVRCSPQATAIAKSGHLELLKLSAALGENSLA